jgi:hypothetical protein
LSVTGGATVTLTANSFAAGHGDVLTLIAGGVTNTSSIGAQNLSFASTLDPVAVSIPYTTT